MNRQEHYMIVAMEECNELSQRISKAMRFGMGHIQQAANDKPEQNPEKLNNKERILREYWDLRAMLGLIGIDAWYSDAVSRAWEEQKREKVRRYLELSKQEGTLEEDLNGW